MSVEAKNLAHGFKNENAPLRIFFLSFTNSLILFQLENKLSHRMKIKRIVIITIMTNLLTKENLKNKTSLNTCKFSSTSFILISISQMLEEHQAICEREGRYVGTLTLLKEFSLLTFSFRS